jgi:hypothetical protein
VSLAGSLHHHLLVLSGNLLEGRGLPFLPPPLFRYRRTRPSRMQRRGAAWPMRSAHASGKGTGVPLPRSRVSFILPPILLGPALSHLPFISLLSLGAPAFTCLASLLPGKSGITPGRHASTPSGRWLSCHPGDSCARFTAGVLTGGGLPPVRRTHVQHSDQGVQHTEGGRSASSRRWAEAGRPWITLWF